MNNTVVAIVAVLVALALGLTLYLYPMSDTSIPDESAATSTPVAANLGEPTKKPTAGTPMPVGSGNTFKSIFTQAGSHECKYEQVTSSGRNSNVVYIVDGKMRGEFRTVSGTTSAGDMMVYNGGYLYVWEEGKTTGTRTAISSIAQLPHAIPTDLESGAVMGTNGNNVSWDCHTWIKDASLMSPPAYVKFTDR